MADRTPAAPLHAAVTDALKRKGMTKVQLHQRSGVARSTIDDWKTQAGPPHSATVLAVADALGLDRNEALRLGGVIPDGEELGEGSADLSEVSNADLLAEIDRLMAEVRRRLSA